MNYSYEEICHLSLPCYVLDEMALESSVTEIQTSLQKWWRNSILSYSVKTNNWPSILKRLERLGVWAEVVSEHEYHLATDCNFALEKRVCNGPAKTSSWIKQVLSDGGLLHLDARSEIETLAEVVNGKKASFGIRVNATEPDFPSEPLSGAQESRFGLSVRDGDLTWLKSFLKANSNLHLTSLHLHCNTKKRSLDGYLWLARFFARLVKTYQLLDVSTFDIGGSFGHDFDTKGAGARWPSWDTYFNGIANVLYDEGYSPKTLRLVIEPGSALISACVDYFSQIVYSRTFNTKKVLQTNGSRLHVDPHLARKNFTGACQILTSCASPNAENIAYIAGATCLEKDRLLLDECLPTEGILHVKKCGAYSYALSPCAFIHPPPSIYLLSKTGKITEVNHD